MVNSQLLEYVRQQFAAGISREEISEALATTGWQLSDIHEALAAFPSPLPVTAPPELKIPAQNLIQLPSSRSHKGAWTTVVILFVIIGAGGAFAAYHYGFFSPSTSPAEIPAPLLPVMPPPAELASSTPQLPLTIGSSSAASLVTNVALTLPTASLTVNNASSTIATASTITLKWSSTNADTFSATESVSNCLISVMDKPDTALSIMSSARGTNSSLSFTKNDLALLSGCTVTITYIAENINMAQKAQATVSISFPNTDATLAQLISMTSLGKSSLIVPTAPATTLLSPPSLPTISPITPPISAPSIPLTPPMTIPITTPVPPPIYTTSTTTTHPPLPVIVPLP